ncbi:MAG: hypothetical protein GC203_02155 [Phenylobacterium sp.]|uniref:hypothetical protein n=1 Tax=Phenylobacterium sp. TaxID=1871053 RepID=UPI0025D51689|nr:hypothetical protein [Phenylobacterium sp.]MBI1196648.1 hypothetical protein [Phenylobacterium sp.]
MDEVARLLALLALVGAALTLAGAAWVWLTDETRRMRRTLTKALGVAPQPILAVRGRGVGLGFDLAAGLIAVTWDRGGWSLTYRLEELIGAELVIDRQVAARAFRGEARRALDQLATPEARVRLRLLFDDPSHPDFQLDLWLPEDDGVRGRLDAEDALAEGNRWMARLEALLRRTPSPRPRAAVAPATAAHTRAAPPPDDDEIEDEPEDIIT